jgi:5-methylthioribose kinase
LERMAYEEAALTLYGRLASGLVPRILHYDSELALLVMERLHPHTTLRQALIKGRAPALLVEQAVRFLADTAFHTSDLAMPAIEKRDRVAYFCGNTELARMVEYRSFVEPYIHADGNRWTSPQLDDVARQTRQDALLKQRVAALQLTYAAKPQALMHGHLTTDAIMVTDTDTKIVDPAFATYGPIGFDIGTLMGHLMIAYFSQAGHGPEGARTTEERWLFDAIAGLWRGFHDRFLGLWRSAHAGQAYPEVLFEGSGGQESLAAAQAEFMGQVLVDALRFLGVAIVRSTLGRDHVADFETIEDQSVRAACERRALLLARELIRDANYITDIGQVVDAAGQIRAGTVADG